MEAKELRISNIIETPYGENYVYGVNRELIQVTIDSDENGTVFDFNLDECKPIQLTVEWILNFGFKNKDEFKYGSKELNGIVIAFFNKGWRLTYNESSIGNPIKYVHQLQNLYYALTGEELAVTE